MVLYILLFETCWTLKQALLGLSSKKGANRASTESIVLRTMYFHTFKSTASQYHILLAVFSLSLSLQILLWAFKINSCLQAISLHCEAVVTAGCRHYTCFWQWPRSPTSIEFHIPHIRRMYEKSELCVLLYLVSFWWALVSYLWACGCSSVAEYMPLHITW